MSGSFRAIARTPASWSCSEKLLLAVRRAARLLLATGGDLCPMLSKQRRWLLVFVFRVLLAVVCSQVRKVTC